MIVRLKVLAAAAAITGIVAAATGRELYAQGASVSVARELYASAAYEDSLRMLDALQAGGPSRDDRRTIGLYRVLCLIAIGRSAEADGRPAIHRLRSACQVARRVLGWGGGAWQWECLQAGWPHARKGRGRTG